MSLTLLLLLLLLPTISIIGDWCDARIFHID
jgi:hypothetical protein